ncbi:ankyrin repeat protein, putative [Trichomonas vaginalis G3]|uniref:Ankyrin repeat protein, putative n=1 Tax=Trichomonas vaginalis (strain ATCC PRA-98 / G3) TaxID=412133 RepID=A2FH26_TRIV3|nr:myotrophin family [Trichomonas vaginalis G3]EAX95794.1 ankyrin repeat protein, putative [Trichomonas vaginalis G3]KAI5536536.1 myotrophin family [Trichomonas vaginalis G3]|eukprot:XP_001308724.1 ankyrin repeat protein [Trichomonas vaginalis G3]
MSSDYYKQYADFIEAFEKLFHIKSNEPIEDMCNIITNTLISKYQLSIKHLTMLIHAAIRYNYASGESYVKILEHIAPNGKKIPEIEFETESSIKYIVMHDQIDKFKEYLIQNSISDNYVFLEIPNLGKYDFSNFGKLSLIEICAYFGSVNIFYFLILNQINKITEKCLSYSVIGGNQDIINECLKENKMDIDCFRCIIRTHNHDLLKYVFDREIFTRDDLYYEKWMGRKCQPIYEDIITYQNLNAVFLLFNRNKYYIFPWGAAFPQTIDIFKNNTFSNKYNRTGSGIIHFACKSQNNDICRLLLESYDQIIVNDNNVEDYELEEEDYEDESILHGPDINEKDKFGETALHVAVRNNCKETAEILISYGANVNEKDEYGKTALHYAAENNDKEIVEVLISHGANINEKDKNGVKAICIAARHNSGETAEVLISHGANINEKDKNGVKAICIAARHNSGETAEVLISHGANINEKYEYGNTTLHFAAENNSKETVEVLVSHGANINEKNQLGKTALHFAAEYNNKEIVEALILHGANLNEKDLIERTALHYAARNNYKEIVEVLISHGANLNEKDEYGKTALHYATNYNYNGIANDLILIGANVNEKDEYRKTALHYAAEGNDKEIVEILILIGANVNEKDEYRKTALHYAAEGNDKEIVEILISHGANLNEKDENGKTALHYAAEGNDKEIVEILISHGANLNEKDENGKTALHYAAEGNDKEIANVLLSHGAKLISVLPCNNLSVKKYFEY